MPREFVWRSRWARRASRLHASCLSKKSGRIREQTNAELEIFVHGALCVAYSGQCFSSEAWGGAARTAGNAHRRAGSNELIVDNELRPLDDARVLLLPATCTRSIMCRRWSRSVSLRLRLKAATRTPTMSR